MSIVIRMCICCRKRELQSDLIRLQCIGKDLVQYTNKGRSFYLCLDCIKTNQKNVLRALAQKCKRKIDMFEMKEFLVYG